MKLHVVERKRVFMLEAHGAIISFPEFHFDELNSPSYYAAVY